MFLCQFFVFYAYLSKNFLYTIVFFLDNKINVLIIAVMDSKLKILLSIFCISFVGLVYAITDECEPCEEGDTSCGGEPGGDSMSMVLEE